MNLFLSLSFFFLFCFVFFFLEEKKNCSSVGKMKNENERKFWLFGAGIAEGVAEALRLSQQAYRGALMAEAASSRMKFSKKPTHN